MISVTIRRSGNASARVPKVVANLQRAVDITADLMSNKAKHLIESGPKSGRIYGAERVVSFQAGKALRGGVIVTKKVSFTANKGKKGHQASAPGEAPATLTGTLVNSIMPVTEGSLKKKVAAHTKYAYILEFMMDRPFMVPAVESQREAFFERCRQGFHTGLTGG